MNALPAAPGGRTLAIFHLAEDSGPSLSLPDSFAWLASGGQLEVVVPAAGGVADAYAGLGSITVLEYSALTFPRGLTGLGRTLARLVKDLRAFRAHIRRSRPTLVIVVTTAIPAALVAARLERVPTILYVGELLNSADGRTLRSLAKRGVRRLVIWGSNALLCCSRTVARQFTTPRGPLVEVVYPPIGEWYAGGSRERGRSRYGIGPDEPCIVAVGNISEGRGQDVLVAALPTLAQRFPRLHCLIVGQPHPRPVDQAYRRGLEMTVAAAGVSNAVTFTGFVKEMDDLYAAADVVVNPARPQFGEPFGRAACEALMAGRPVVATNVGAIPEVLRHGEDALLVPPDDPDALAAGVTRLLEDPAFARRLVASGGERVRELFSDHQALSGFARVVTAVTR